MQSEEKNYHGHRRNISPGSRELARNGITIPDGLDPLDGDYPMFSPEVDQVWLAHKEEFYQINAVLVNYFVSSALYNHQHNPKYEFIVKGRDVGWAHGRRGGNYSYGDMKSSLKMVGKFIHTVVGEHIDSDIKLLEESLLNPKAVNHPLTRLYRRYRKLFNFSSKYEVYDNLARDKNERMGGDTPQRTMKKGLGSGMDVMSAALNHIPVLFRQDFPGEEINAGNLIGYGVNSFSPIAEQSMANMRHFIDFPTEDVTNFKLLKNRNTLRLAIKKGKLNKGFDQETYFRILKNRPFDLLELGCPSMVDFGDDMDQLLQSGGLGKIEEGSSTFVLWLWALHLARPIYVYWFE